MVHHVLMGSYVGLNRCYKMLPKPYIVLKHALHWAKPDGM